MDRALLAWDTKVQCRLGLTRVRKLENREEGAYVSKVDGPL